MALRLPDGATLSIATAYAAAVAISAITNADPAVVSAASHGNANGDLVEVLSGWNKLNGSVRRVAGQASGTYQLEGLDTLDVNQFPAGTGAGSARKINTFTQIQQITGLTTSGGEQQYATEKLLEENFERQLPTYTSAQSLEVTIADDPSLPGYIAAKKASDKGDPVAVKLQLKNGSLILYVGILSLNETPSLNSGEAMKVTLAISLQGRPVRYAA